MNALTSLAVVAAFSLAVAFAPAAFACPFKTVEGPSDKSTAETIVPDQDVDG